MNVSENTRHEPFGHLMPETKLERHWAQNNTLTGLRRQRVTRFDPHACATYASMTYVSDVAKLRHDLPDDEWIRDSLKTFIRTEFSERRTALQTPTFKVADLSQIEISDSVLTGLARKVDEEVQSIVDELQFEGASKEPAEMARQIYKLVCHPRVGSRTNQLHVSEIDFVSKLTRAIDNQERLLLVLLGFPFKDQNRFRVEGPADQPDAGEIAFLLRLYRITQAIYQVHPYGADVLVLADGEIYHEIFGVSREATVSYLEKVKAYRSQLNLQGAVSFIPLSDLITKASRNSNDLGEHGGANGVTQHIGERIAYLFEHDHSLRELTDTLINAVKWNHESKSLLDGFKAEDAWAILTLGQADVPEHLRSTWSALHQTASISAVKYASVNLMLRWLDLVNLFFPEAIRCTIHAKPGQVCLARSGSAFPWNGVAWTEDWPTSIDDFEVRPFHSLGDFGPVRKVIIRALGNPYFFTRATYGSNITAARSVLPVDGWSLDEAVGRPFTLNDTTALASLGAGDENFSWERLPEDGEYYRKILKFRLDHYSQYGFGVHGIWIDSLLVGQSGLQVLNETRDQVELVIFLGKAYVRKGLGLKLSRHILSRCTDAGVKAIYGVARTENTAALELLRRLDGKPIRAQVHFGSIATVYDIPLKRS